MSTTFRGAQPALGHRAVSRSPCSTRRELSTSAKAQPCRRVTPRVSAHADAGAFGASSSGVDRSGGGARQALLPTVAKLGAICAAAAAAQAAAPAFQGPGGGGFGFGGGGGSGGGGWFGRAVGLAPAWAEEDAADEEEEDVEYEEVTDDEGDAEYEVAEPEDGAEGDGEGDEEEGDNEEPEDEDLPDPTSNKFFVQEIRVHGLPAGKGIPTQEDLFAGLKCQPGFVCTRQELSDDLRSLFQMQLFDKVDGKVTPGQGRKRILDFTLKTSTYPEIKSFKVNGSTLLPPEVVDRVMKEKKPGPTTFEILGQVKNVVEGWYNDRGYAYSYVTSFEGLDRGEVVANINESKVASVSVVYMDDEGQPVKTGGVIPQSTIMRELRVKPGMIYNLEDGRKALRDVFALQLFDNVQVLPRQRQTDESKIDVEVMVKERPMQTAEVECEWSIAPNDSGKPSLVSMVPGGSLMYEHKNLGRKGQQLAASVNAQNLLAPGDELGFRVDFKQPYIFGGGDQKKTALALSAFNVRKVSGVFIPGPSGEEVPPVFIDRSGLKASLQEQYTRNSRGTLSLVVEQVSALDEGGAPAPTGSRVVQTAQGGALDPNGPPTTLSARATDRLMFLQGAVTRDATYLQNGTPIGPRDILQVDQGLGVGTHNAFFNKHTLSLTRFCKLRDPAPGSSTPPLVLVVHGRYGNIVGDMASYDAFTLGGPYSVRGFSVGELAACRRFAEAALELRVPVLGRQLFAFYETGSDLSSSKLVRGNPTEYYRRSGRGTSLGAGVKLGAVRAEYCTEGGALDSGAFFLRFGERY